MKNLTILFLSICLITLYGCVRSDSTEFVEPIVESKLEKKKAVKMPINKVNIKSNIQKNNEQIKDIGKEIDNLLKHF